MRKMVGKILKTVIVSAVACMVMGGAFATIVADAETEDVKVVVSEKETGENVGVNTEEETSEDVGENTEGETDDDVLDIASPGSDIYFSDGIDNFYLHLGSKIDLKKYKSNVKGYKWTSLNKKIATVSSKGIIKGKKAGKAKIEGVKGNTKIRITVYVHRAHYERVYRKSVIGTPVGIKEYNCKKCISSKYYAKTQVDGTKSPSVKKIQKNKNYKKVVLRNGGDVQTIYYNKKTAEIVYMDTVHVADGFMSICGMYILHGQYKYEDGNEAFSCYMGIATSGNTGRIYYLKALRSKKGLFKEMNPDDLTLTTPDSTKDDE